MANFLNTQVPLGSYHSHIHILHSATHRQQIRFTPFDNILPDENRSDKDAF